MIELIKHAVDLNYQNQNRQDTQPERYAREFKTIHLNVGRRSGKTTAIEALARPTDLLLFPNYHTMETLRSRHYFLCPINTIEGVLLSANTLHGRIIKKYNWVWIDEPSLCDDVVDINRIYETIDADLFILLGE